MSQQTNALRATQLRVMELELLDKMSLIQVADYAKLRFVWVADVYIYHIMIHNNQMKRSSVEFTQLEVASMFINQSLMKIAVTGLMFAVGYSLL